MRSIFARPSRFAYEAANLIELHALHVLIAIFVILSLLSGAAIKSGQLDADLANWLQRSPRLDRDLAYVNANLGEGQGSSSQILLQTPTEKGVDVLSKESLMVHLDALTIATHATVELFDVTWTLKDLCFTPTLPDKELPDHMTHLLENLLPCAIKTPLDCFWEGAKLLGPEQPVTIGSPSPKLKWTSLDPLLALENFQEMYPYYKSLSQLIDLLKRVGITGYLQKPCLDPTNQNCPMTASNKNSLEPPNIHSIVSKGCSGFAANRMHWKEDEIIGGLVRNKSGQIVRAEALQSTILLMGEQDLYDFWRKTHKVQDINQWSVEKARAIIETWQKRFKDELTHFSSASPKVSSDYKVHAMTFKSILEPVDVHTLLDLTSFQLSFILMTVLFCATFPSFSNRTPPKQQESHKSKSKFSIMGRIKCLMLALISSTTAGLTFIASLGISSAFNLPYNLATTQVLPPIALYYVFHQFHTIAIIYSQHYEKQTSRPIRDQIKQSHPTFTFECLDELYPAILIESSIYLIGLLVAFMVPVLAMQVFALQAILFVICVLTLSLTLMPALMSLFLLERSKNHDQQDTIEINDGKLDKKLPNVIKKDLNELGSSRSESCSPAGRVRVKARRTLRGGRNHEVTDMSFDQIFSRLKEDLNTMRASSCEPSDINFSAQFGSNSLQTSFRVTRSSSPATNTNMVTKKPRGPTGSITSDPFIKHSDYLFNDNSIPDLVGSMTSSPARPTHDVIIEENYDLESNSDSSTATLKPPSLDEPKSENESATRDNTIFQHYRDWLTRNKPCQAIICFAKIGILFALITIAPKICYNLRVTDIISRASPDYEMFYIQEKYFPVYNVFAVTKGNFDYPANQKLLHEYHRSLNSIKGIVKDGKDEVSKFWLTALRDWLIDLQEKFDIDKNNSNINTEGWTGNVSESSKLAYKLLVQTGKPENPIDKSLVETNRLVDTDGMINQKAFYHYLTAWVMNDQFTYSMSEANFKPEPKTWFDNPEDLRVEKAKSLTYAQMPFIVKVSDNDHDESSRIVSEFRRISRAFEQLNLPNFTIGSAFMFWEQFINLDIVTWAMAIVAFGSIFIVVGLMTSDFIIAAIIIFPMMISLIELYWIMGQFSIPFNNILAIILVSNIGMASVQGVPLTTYFYITDGDLQTRANGALRHRFRIIFSSSLLLLLCAAVFSISKIGFIIKYSWLVLGMTMINSFNALLLAPIMLSMLGSKRSRPARVHIDQTSSMKSFSNRKHNFEHIKNKFRSCKRKGAPKFQSKFSLSTIAEEPQSDLNIDLSIKCY